MGINTERLESEIFQLGGEIFKDAQDSRLTVFDPEFYSGKLLDWAMKDEAFKVSLFRFVDVLPSLEDSAALIRHAQEYFEPVAHRLPGFLKWGLNVEPDSIPAKLAAPVIKKQIRSVAERFIIGETPKEALKTLRKLRKDGIAFTVDLLGEATVSEPESRVFYERYLDLIEALSKELPTWAESKPLIQGHRGDQNPLNISVKLSALYSQTKAINHEKSVAILTERFGEIVAKVRGVGGFVYIDMEDCAMTSMTIDVFTRLLSSAEFKDFSGCGLVLQAYLRRTESDVDSLVEWAKKRGAPVGIRLVKGAYWDSETISAKQNGWEIPVWQQKVASDACYEKLSIKLLENSSVILPAFGSHNIRSLVHAVKAAELLGVPRTHYELQALYGMAEPIKQSFVSRGYFVRDYSPIGELLPGMAYLVRRLLENTSNEGFLRQSFHEHERAEVLLRKPVVTKEELGTEHINLNQRQRFTNCALTDFTVAENRALVASELAALKSQLQKAPIVVQPIIDGKFVRLGRSISAVSPENPDIVVGNVELADNNLADKTLHGLQSYFPKWRATTIESRAEILFRAAEIMLAERAKLSALITLEEGKPWAEADADVVEAIDFLNYYAHEALRLGTPRRMGDYPGEHNSYFYEPRGVCVVIGPWNFPLAIPCGMLAAALVMGNCAVLKPAEQSSVIAGALFKILLDAGLPPQAAAFLPGLGEEIGEFMVNDARVSTVVFTGSKEVGLSIIKSAAEVRPGQEHIKRVIAEMGGKNAIIVDEGADLDEALRGVLHSAFGYSGQKCSACSRLIIVGDIYDKFLERLSEGVKSLIVGPPSEPGSAMGPVIDEVAFKRIWGTIEEAKLKCKLVAQGSVPNTVSPRGYYVPPTVFAEIPKDHPLLRNEIFGPVLAVVRSKTFNEALSIACGIEYGLTGAIFSRSPKNIETAIREYRVGNLYINRGSTGALVYRQPFGGAKMSGVGSKAGGPDYLLQFVVPRAVSENTMRRGFAPEL